jgi:hypothetical protein
MVQAIDVAPEQDLRVVILYTEKGRYSTPVGYNEFIDNLDKEPGMYRDWLQCKLTIEEAEAKNMVFDSRLGRKRVLFSFENAEWKALIGQMLDGDELWEFVSPENTWQNLCGRAGIALVRDGEVIYVLITRMN